MKNKFTSPEITIGHQLPVVACDTSFNGISKAGLWSTSNDMIDPTKKILLHEILVHI